MQDWYFSGAAPIFFHIPFKFEFCLPTMGTTVPASRDWLDEIKFDGYRLGVERNGDRVRLITRGSGIGSLILTRQSTLMLLAPCPAISRGFFFARLGWKKI
jgi:hypothetical protein